jgi:hypothetical protein
MAKFLSRNDLVTKVKPPVRHRTFGNAHQRLPLRSAAGQDSPSPHMRSRYQIKDPDRAHFITSTIVDWLPVFTSPACCLTLGTRPKKPCIIAATLE